MTDAELLAVLTPVPPEGFDPPLRFGAERAELEGYHLSAFDVAGLVEPPAPTPRIVVAHKDPCPSMAAIRAAYNTMRRRCQSKRRWA